MLIFFFFQLKNISYSYLNFNNGFLTLSQHHVSSFNLFLITSSTFIFAKSSTPFIKQVPDKVSDYNITLYCGTERFKFKYEVYDPNIENLLSSYNTIMFDRLQVYTRNSLNLTTTFKILNLYHFNTWNCQRIIRHYCVYLFEIIYSPRDHRGTQKD